MSAKVLFLGLDAADPELILKWSQDGELPNLSRLMQQGAWGGTKNPPGLYVGAIWPSFTTSVTPARHTRYCFTQLIPGKYDSTPFRPEQLKYPPFWQFLGEQGKRIAVIDIPKTAIAPVNGMQIVDWGTHDPEYGEIRCWPESIKAEIDRRFGKNPVHDCNGARSSVQDFTDFRDILTQRIQHKKEIISHYLEDDDWDCMIASFSESHCVGHQCWHFNDDTHPRYDPAISSACGNPMLDVYRALDSSVGELLEQAGPDTLAIVLASHGMGPHYEATYLLDSILERFERARYRTSKPALRKGLKKIWGSLPKGLRKRWQPARAVAKSAGLSPLASRRFFKIPNNDVFGGVRINLAGREPHGRVQPGNDFEQVCDDLIEDLHTLVNAESGEKLVLGVIKTRDVYSGENLDYLPDLMIEWNRSSPINVLHSPLIGTIRGEYTGCRTGDHKHDGLFFTSGNGVTPGQLHEPVSVMDFGPTIARHIGLDLPNVDGKPIEPVTSTARSA